MNMFPTEEAATEWFESVLWPTGRCCGKCGSVATREVPNSKPMPYWCTDCRNYFSVRTGTPIARSNVPLRKWAIAIYLCLTSLKSVSSMKLRRDIGVSQPTAWFMLHRIRQAWATDSDGGFSGPVEVDETYFGGKRRNMSNAQRKALKDTGRGAGWQDGGCGCQGSHHKTGHGQGSSIHRRRNPSRLRHESRRPRRDRLHRRCYGLHRPSLPAWDRQALGWRVRHTGWPTPTGSSRSGPCSSERIRAPSTR